MSAVGEKKSKLDLPFLEKESLKKWWFGKTMKYGWNKPCNGASSLIGKKDQMLKQFIEFNCKLCFLQSILD
ncbi:unnamed protein product [Soboliphyme baturini]|uniref:Uncharacterized protein n=1 Tax=Soboliphyme baturini TaxID=241478 RepID=A0A183INH6_9BILA|nr:unnamed protein product [Soboliphyme baturini]